MGAYRDDQLHAVDISYKVHDTIIDDVFFSDTDSQPLKVTDFLLHTLRERAKATDAEMMFRGFPSGNVSLDRAKIARGCKVLTRPAYCNINPVALQAARLFSKHVYNKLLAVTSDSMSQGMTSSSVVGGDVEEERRN